MVRKSWRGMDFCPECGNELLVTDQRTGEVTCPQCGYVVQERDVDMGPEWRNLEEEEGSRSRVGAPLSPMYRDHGLSTVIERVDQDASGRKLSKETQGEDASPQKA
jgi:transcription initiation factor TFIIB